MIDKLQVLMYIDYFKFVHGDEVITSSGVISK